MTNPRTCERKKFIKFYKTHKNASIINTFNLLLLESYYLELCRIPKRIFNIFVHRFI